MGALEADAGQGHWGSLQGGSGAPVTMADRESQVATADREPQVAMADREPRVAMADLWIRTAMVDRELRVAMADPGTRTAMADRVYGPPPQNLFWWPAGRGVLSKGQWR